MSKRPDPPPRPDPATADADALDFELLGVQDEPVWPPGPEPTVDPDAWEDRALAEPEVELDWDGPEPDAVIDALDQPQLLSSPSQPEWIDEASLAPDAGQELELGELCLAPSDSGDGWPDETDSPTDLESFPLDSAALEEDFWDPSTDELHLLPAGRTRIGLEEWVRIAGLGKQPLRALCDPAALHSRLAVAHRWIGPDRIELQVAGETHLLDIDPAGEGDRAGEGDPGEGDPAETRSQSILELELTLGATRHPVRFQLEQASDAPPIRLGRDVLAGGFVIDPAERFVLGSGAT